MSGKTWKPLNLAVEIDRAPQTVRNTLRILKQLKLVDNIEYGLYTITDLGRERYKAIAQSSNVQSLGEDKP